MELFSANVGEGEYCHSVLVGAALLSQGHLKILSNIRNVFLPFVLAFTADCVVNFKGAYH